VGRRGSKLRGGISQGGCIKFGSPSHASLEMRRARRSLPTVAWCIAKLPLPPHRGRSIPPRPPRCIHWVVQDNCMERLVFPLTATLPHRLRAHGKTPAGCGQGSVLGFGARARLHVQNSVTAQLLLISVAASARRAPKLGGKLGGCIFSSCAMLGTGGSDCCRQGSVPPSSPHAAAADVARTSAHASRVGQRPPQPSPRRTAIATETFDPHPRRKPASSLHGVPVDLASRAAPACSSGSIAYSLTSLSG
jgi:hypothetical protein